MWLHFFLVLRFSPLFEKIEFMTFFSKLYFLIKILKICQYTLPLSVLN